jgi:hypothetical protein
MATVAQQLVRAVAFPPHERLQLSRERKKFALFLGRDFQRDDRNY